MLEHGERPRPAVYFIVADDGPGIDPAFLPRAFEKFEKNSSSSGTGLGLYMVRLMVDALGGSIGVSTSQEGTIFQIALPAHTRDRVMETV
jgi:two-component system sensor histidine kinase TrcS